MHLADVFGWAAKDYAGDENSTTGAEVSEGQGAKEGRLADRLPDIEGNHVRVLCSRVFILLIAWCGANFLGGWG